MVDYAQAPNLPTMFFEQCDRFGDAPFLWEKRHGEWTPRSWSNTADEVARLAAGLEAKGIGPGDRVVLVSENRPEWMIADLAIMSIGAVTVPAYTTNTVEDHRHILTDSGAKAAIVSNQDLAERLLPAASGTGLEFAVMIDALPANASADLPLFQQADLMAGADGGSIREKARTLDRGAMCCIIYTSGTGGVPNGVMLSHGNIICNALSAEDMLSKLPGFAIGGEIFLSFLPLSHSYEHTTGQFVPISIGAQVYYAEGLDKLVQNIGEVRPTIMTAVPRLYETMRTRILRAAEKSGGLKEKLLHKAVEIGKKRYRDPGSLTLCERALDPLLTKLVRSKVSERFGGRLKAFVSGGAPLNQDVAQFFTALGLRILQGYGQTEAAPVVSCNYPTLNKLHTVGPPLEGVEIRIAEDGEILVRGELVMLGYWNDPDRTAETVKDGWLHTGDIGKLDEDGYLMITDRKKDIIVNSGGDNLSPQRVEGIVCLEPEIAQAMVYGDKRPHLVALLTPDPDWLKDWQAENGAIEGAWNDSPALRKALQEALDRVNKKLSVIERVRRFIIVDEPFSIENTMLTPSMKIRRHIVRQTYGDRLEGLYSN
ncbi:AMP-dependent synthetase/ligase [Hwanghaeella sp.]|uniref:AMP-dependent synthetase/ligase n=1 Tax=Hwanghaeella sp. TaxID=2605943 RepID=UPI003CCBDACC